MTIEKINFSYPKGSLQSVFDTQEMTALELAAKTSKKVDECVELVNGVEQSAIEATAVVEEMRADQYGIIQNLSEVVIPDATQQFINDKVMDGTFNGIINQQIFGQLNSEVDGLEQSVEYINQLTNGHTASILSLIDKDDMKTSEIYELERISEGHSTTITNLIGSSSAHGVEIQNANEKLSQHDGSLNALGTSLTNVDAYVNAIAKSVDDQGSEISELQSGIVNTSVEIFKNASKNKTGYLYDNAMHSMNVKYDLPYSLSAIKKGTLKVAFIGDSISEGANNLHQDNWVTKFMVTLKRKLSKINVEYTNFCLGGRGIHQFNNPNYKATANETDHMFNFKRDWSVVGKSWRDHVKDYKPDLIIVAFGMNDTYTSINPDSEFEGNLFTMYEYLTANISADHCLVTTILPTQNKVVYGQNEMNTQMLARLTEEHTKTTGKALIDANRLWRIMLYGKDDHVVTNKTIGGIAEIHQHNDIYNFELTLTMNSAVFPSMSSQPDIIFRTTPSGDRLTLRFTNDGNDNAVVLYSSKNSNTTASIVFNHILPANLQTVTVKVEGSKFTVNGTDYYFYQKLCESKMNLAGIEPFISYISLIKRVPFNQEPTFTELELLGEVTTPIGMYNNGNGINHPTAQGHEMAYYNASLPVINSLEAPVTATFKQEGSISGRALTSGVTANYVMSSMIPLVDATYKTITINSGTISGVREMTAGEIAKLSLQKYVTGFTFQTNDTVLTPDIANKVIDVTFTVS